MRNRNIKGMARLIEGRVLEQIERSGVGSLLVAVSGGADSVALLTACSRIARREAMRVEAVNCNFHLRGEESDRDSEFVASLCRRLGVELHTRDYDVKGYVAAHPGISTEMACRELRYSDFYDIRKSRGLDRVAVAHNADDDIETMLLNMLRGSGSRGLKGMDTDNGKVIRPLLTTTRKEIELYLAEMGQDYMTDSTNLTDEYRRNFLRHDVIPLFESRWEGARKSLSRSVEIMKEESAIIESHYSRLLKKYSDSDRRRLQVYAPEITLGAILRFIEPYGGNHTAAREIQDALGKPFAGRRWHLIPPYTAVLERDSLAIIDNSDEDSEPQLKWDCIEMSDSAMQTVRQNKSHDIIYLPQGKDAYISRKPQTGDRIAPLGMRGTRLVSDIISDARLDSIARRRVRVLERKEDGEVIWITGLKRSRHELIAPDVAIIHRAEFLREETSEH